MLTLPINKCSNHHPSSPLSFQQWTDVSLLLSRLLRISGICTLLQKWGAVSAAGRLHTLVHWSHLHLSLHASKHHQSSTSEEKLYTNTSTYTIWNTESWNRQLGKIVNLCCLQLSLHIQPTALVRISPVTKSSKAQPFNGTGFSPTCAICLSSFDRGISSK